MLLTPERLQDFFNQLDLRFQNGYKARTYLWGEYAETVPSNTEMNTYSWLAELPGLREWIGPRLIRNISARAYQLINKDFEGTVKVDKRKLEDDQDGIFGRHAELLGDSAARWPEDLLTDALLANGICYDNQNFFDTDHPVDLDDASKGTYANNYGGKALSVDTYNEMWANMMGFKGESGKPMGITPTVLMVDPSNRKIAMQIANGELVAEAIKQAGSNVGGAGVSNVNKNEIKVVVNARVAAGDWYLMSTDRLKPMVFQQRQTPVTTYVTDPQHPSVFNEKAFIYGVEARGAAGYTLPFLAIRCQAAAL